MQRQRHQEGRDSTGKHSVKVENTRIGPLLVPKARIDVIRGLVRFLRCRLRFLGEQLGGNDQVPELLEEALMLAFRDSCSDGRLRHGVVSSSQFQGALCKYRT